MFPSTEHCRHFCLVHVILILLAEPESISQNKRHVLTESLEFVLWRYQTKFVNFTQIEDQKVDELP